MKKSRIGKIDFSRLNTLPEKHEFETAKFFADRGYNVVFLAPCYIPGSKNPDFMMADKIWETKSPIGDSKRLFEMNIRKAMKQSENIIIDLRRMKKSSEKWCLNKINIQKDSSRIKTLLVITKDGRLLTIKGKFGSI